MRSRHWELWFLKTLGLEITAVSGNERICTCPWCDKEGHLYLNASTLVYDCKHCGEHGGYLGLLAQLAASLAEDFTVVDQARLARDRGLPADAFSGYGFGSTGKFYTLPVRRADGRVVNVLRYTLGEKLKSAPGCQAGLFGAELLADTERKGEPVYLAEGAWDAIALEWLRRKAHQKGVVVAVPGASVFKGEWLDWFRGRDVKMAYDNDEAGAKGEQRAARMLRGTAKSLVFLRWHKGEKIGKDLRDLIVGAQ